MKFGTKLTLYISLIIAVMFFLSGHLMIKQSFDFALEQIIKQYQMQHINYRILLENKTYVTAPNPENLYEKQLRETAGLIGKLSQIAIYTESSNQVYSSVINGDTSLMKELVSKKEGYLIKSIGETHVLGVVSPVLITDKQMYLISFNDISEVFTQSNQQYTKFLYFNVLLVLIAIIFVGLFAKKITYPLKKLTAISDKISSGAYYERTNITTNDEIGLLSKSFDKMANSIESKILSLEAAIRSRDDFVSIFTHELKTPMTSIMGYADMLRSRENETEIQIKAANYIYKESKRISNLSLKLMDLMALSNEYIEIKPIAAHKLLSDELQGSMQKATVLADKTLIYCVIRNLYTNAQNTKAADIQITGIIKDNIYQISVTDNGCGIPKNFLTRIKEPFYTVDKSRSRENGGSGLGLALCEKILQFHGTSLTIQSTINTGTTVSFDLQLLHDTV